MHRRDFLQHARFGMFIHSGSTPHSVGSGREGDGIARVDPQQCENLASSTRSAGGVDVLLPDRGPGTRLPVVVLEFSEEPRVGGAPT